MDFWNYFDLFGRFNQLTCSGPALLNMKEPSPLQISIKHGTEIKYKFVRTHENTIKFYNGDDFVQEFISHEVILEWIQQFLQFNASYQIIWHREDENGMCTPYSEESLVKLLKLLISNEVV